MTIFPPSGMASRALVARFSIASSELVDIGQDRLDPLGKTGFQCHRRSQRAAQQSADALHQGGKLHRFGFELLLPGKSQHALGQGHAAQCTLGGVVEQPDDFGVVRRRRLRTISRLPRMTVSRLLKSWAIPPLSWPMACIFCAWNSASRVCSSTCCAWVTSVMSRVILAKPSNVPVSPQIGSTTT